MADEGADSDADTRTDRGGDRNGGSPDDARAAGAGDGAAGTGSAGETRIEKSGADDDSEWRYRVVGADDDAPTVGVATRDGTSEAGAPTGENQGEGEGVAGPVAPSMPVESGTPDLENALFVAAGALLTLLVIASAVASLDPAAVLGLTGAVAVAAGGLYGFFRVI